MTTLKYTNKATEKIWNVLQEIEEKRQLGIKNNPIRIAYYPNSKNRNDNGLFETRKIVLENLQSQKAIIKLHRVVAGNLYYWAFKLDKYYPKIFLKYEKLYSEMVMQYEESKKPPPKQATYSFDKKRGILTIKGQEILFKDEGRRIPYLDLLIKRKDYVYHSEEAKELEGADKKMINNPKKIYYEACRGIKARLLEFGITDFLEFTFNKARINPLYKKS